MTVEFICKQLNLKIAGSSENIDKTVTGGYVSDLLSDVMGNAKEGNIWITLQTHKNCAAIASLKDLAAIIIVKNLKPEEDMLEQCNREGIPVLLTEQNTFEIVGKLYQLCINNGIK